MTNPVQTWSGSAFSTSITATASSAPVSGHGVVVGFSARNNHNITSLVDNQTGSPNTYTRVALEGSVPDVEIWYCNSVTINQSSFTLTATLSGTDGGKLFAAEVIGLNGVDQQTATNSNTAATSYSVTNGSANTNANDFVLAVFGTSYNTSSIGLSDPPTSGYTSIAKYDANADNAVDCGYKVVSAIETSSAAWTWSTSLNPMSAAIASFKLLGNSDTAYSPINLGTAPFNGTGDAGRVGGTKLNDALATLYSALGERALTPGVPQGISSSAGTTTTLVDATQTWATNQFAGQYVTITTGTAPTVSGGTATATSNLGYSALIASNTATTLTFAALPFATTVGCGYEISPVVTTAQTDGFATAVGGTAPSTIVDSTKSWSTNAWQGYQATLMSGPYAGKAFPIVSNTATALTLNSNLTTAIAAGTAYIIGTRPPNVRQKITTGTSATIANGTRIVQIIGPTTMALTTPANPVDGDQVSIVNNGTSTITTFSVVANSGQTAPTVPATLTAQQGIGIYYEADTATWYRLY